MPESHRSVAECIAVLPGPLPAGADALECDEWPELQFARREERADPAQLDRKMADWPRAEGLASEILASRSKDLRVGIYLLEAKVRLHGLRGLEEGLLVLRSLVEQFWDRGLHPLLDDGGLRNRGRALEWLGGSKAHSTLSGIPLTGRIVGVNYSLADYLQSRQIGFEKDTKTTEGDGGYARKQARKTALERGGVSGEMFDLAAEATGRTNAEYNLSLFRTAAREFAALEKILSDRLLVSDENGEIVLDARPSLSETRKVLEQIGSVLGIVMERSRPDSSRKAPVPKAEDKEAPAPASPKEEMPVFAEAIAPIADVEMGEPAGVGWSHAEHLVRGGEIEKGLAEMVRLAAAEHGRARFQRRLTLAEMCLEQKKEKLAVAILEELNEQIQSLKLEQWESSELIGRVWGNLYRHYQREQDTRDRAAQLYKQLSRLDPWQALRWEA